MHLFLLLSFFSGLLFAESVTPTDSCTTSYYYFTHSGPTISDLAITSLKETITLEAGTNTPKIFVFFGGKVKSKGAPLSIENRETPTDANGNFLFKGQVKDPGHSEVMIRLMRGKLDEDTTFNFSLPDRQKCKNLIPPATVTLNLQRRTPPEKKVNLRTPFDAHSLLAGAFDFGVNYLIPSAHFQRLLFGTTSIGGDFGILSFSSQSNTAFVMKWFFSIDHYFSNRIFWGPWLRAGVGLYRFRLNDSGLSETIYSPATEITLGWRWPISYRFTIGASLGAQYLTKKHGDLFTLDLSGLLGIATVDVGFLF